MPDLRQSLIVAGWRQGAVLRPEPFSGREALGFLVLNQTCDCINPDFVKEPYLELLPLEKLTEKPDSRFERGQNPRQIHFQIEERGQKIWVNARIADIFQFERRNHESLEFATEYSLPRPTLDDLIRWRAQRYVRTAFPDSFEAAFKPISKKFGNLVSQHESRIDSLLISLSPFEEIETGDCYQIQLRLMVKPGVMAQPQVANELKEAAESIQGLLCQSSWFESPKCTVTSLNTMTLWEAREFVDFTRYDYLSFGQDEPPPGAPSSNDGGQLPVDQDGL